MIEIMRHVLQGCDKVECKEKHRYCEDDVALDISLGTTNCGWLFGNHKTV
jgi:hypothetical protein